MAAFFDRMLSDQGGVGFLREDRIDEMLRRLIPGAKITKGAYVYPSRAELRDLCWNHMDQGHRPFIHDTYTEAARLFIAERAAFSLTRFGRWPAVIPVFDGYFKENGFYQILSLFGLFIIVNIIECEPTEHATQMRVRWAIASHRIFGWFHGSLNRRLASLNAVQNRDDDPIRDRRVELRSAGYRFKTDFPTFLNSNIIDDNAIFPPATPTFALELDELAEGTIVRKDFGDRAYLFRRQGERVEVWPGVCLHEGASLGGHHVQDGKVKCPWHGLEFPGRVLADGQSMNLCGARIERKAEKIILGPVKATTAHEAVG